MFKSKSPLLFVMFGLSLVGLTGCHENPIKKMPPAKATLILLKASQNAEKELNIDRPFGWVYSSCMNDMAHKIDCEEFYKTMLRYVQKNDAFRHARLNDLKDKDVFATLAEDYDIKQFYEVY